MWSSVASMLAPARCAACGERLRVEAALCAACVLTLEPPPPLPSGLTASFAFGGAVATLVHAAKYQGLGPSMRAAERLVCEGLPDRAGLDAVVPVVSHARRVAERGLDQAACLARAVAAALRLPCWYEGLERRRETVQLARLDAKSRSAAVEGAFVAARRLEGRTVLLVDDVHTTGATLRAAASAVATVAGRTQAHVLAATPAR